MKFVKYTLSLILVFLLTSCNSPKHTPVAQEGLIDVGGYGMYLHCEGTGSPIVIMDAGYNDVSETWSLVQSDVAKFTRVCSYDRAGLGKSDTGPVPRDSSTIVKELHTLLSKADENGPYILVGHSLGGIYMRMFADSYPDDVSGLVLVDAAHVDDVARVAKVLPPITPDESESLKSLREWLANPPSFPGIPDHIFEPGSLGDLPVMVLTVPQQKRPDDLPVKLRDSMDEIWVDLQNEWAQLSRNSTQIFVENSGHFIQQDQPKIVVDAIYQVFQKVHSAE